MARSKPESGLIPDAIAEVANTDRAVSPIIGVVLMVAITVTVSAVVGTMVLGLGPDLSQTSPTVDVTFQETSSGEISVTHGGGDTIDSGTVEVVYTNSTGSTVREEWKTPIQTGDSPSSGPFNVKSGTTMNVVWTNADGSESYILESYTVAA